LKFVNTKSPGSKTFMPCFLYNLSVRPH